MHISSVPCIWPSTGCGSGLEAMQRSIANASVSGHTALHVDNAVLPQVYERTVYKIHHALANNIRFLPGSNEDLCVSAASDGFVKIFDLDLGESSAEVRCLPWHILHTVIICRMAVDRSGIIEPTRQAPAELSFKAAPSSATKTCCCATGEAEPES